MINLKLIPEVGRSMRVEVLTTLKRSAGGHTVRELADRFGMSYMGIKAHCVQLEREGLLHTERRPKPVGRPELLYRLTPRGHAVFSEANTPNATVTSRPLGGARLAADMLEAVRRAYGPAAADKLLFGVFARWAEDFRARLADCEDLPERAAGLARLRDEEGYLATLDGSPTLPAPPDRPANSPGPTGPVIRDARPPAAWTRAGVETPAAASSGDGPLRIVENGSPLAALLRVYPLIGRLERELFEKVLGCPVQRTQEDTRPGIYRCVFELTVP